MVAQPAAAHEQRLGRSGALHLDQVVVVLAIRLGLGCRLREGAHGGGADRCWLVGRLRVGLIRDGRPVIACVTARGHFFHVLHCRFRASGAAGRGSVVAAGSARGRLAGGDLPDHLGCWRCRVRGRAGRGGLGAGRGGGGDGEHDLDVDGGVAGDQVGEGFAAGLFDVGAGAGGDEVVGEAGRWRPRRWRRLRWGRCRAIRRRRVRRPSGAARCWRGPLGAFAHQVGGDALEQHPGAPPQGGGVVAEVAVECGDDGVGDVGGCDFELERDDTGAVGVELPGRHRLVQPAQPARLGQVTVVGRRPGPDPRPGARPARRGAGPGRARHRSPGRPGRPRRG